MTNFRKKKYTSCVSQIAQETNLKLKLNCKKYTDIFAQGDANEVRPIKSKSCFVYIKSLFNLFNG